MNPWDVSFDSDFSFDWQENEVQKNCRDKGQRARSWCSRLRLHIERAQYELSSQDICTSRLNTKNVSTIVYKVLTNITYLKLDVYYFWFVYYSWYYVYSWLFRMRNFTQYKTMVLTGQVQSTRAVVLHVRVNVNARKISVIYDYIV